MGVLDGAKNFYFACEDKWYGFLDKVDSKIPVYEENLDNIKGYIEDSNEGRWTVTEAIKNAVPTPTIAMALFERFRYRFENTPPPNKIVFG